MEEIRNRKYLDEMVEKYGFDTAICMWFAKEKAELHPTISRSILSYNKQKATDVIRKLREIDKRDNETIIRVINFSFTDSFWSIFSLFVVSA